MTIDFVRDIEDFHVKFGLTYAGPPRRLPDDLATFRSGFLQEELNEYNAAFTKVDQLDALVDLVYVALGTAYLQGFDFREAWRRVHAANMLKVRATHASQSARNSTADVVKPDGWQKPNLIDLV